MSLPVRLGRIAVLDWYDGPVEGVLEVPADHSFWHFTAVAERPETEKADSRLFALRVLPQRETDDLFARLFVQAGHQRLIVAPPKRSDGEDLARLVSQDRPAELLMLTDGFEAAEGLWRLAPRADRDTGMRSATSSLATGGTT